MAVYLATSTGKAAQRKCRGKTMAEMLKVDAKLTSTVKGGS